MTLYIDTHATKLILALLNPSITALKEVDSNLHSKNTIPLLAELLQENNLEVEDLDEVIVISGPGSFTGVRIGIVIAKMLGFTKNITIKPISFLEAVSLNYDQEVILGLKDKNGAFIATFNNHKLIKDYEYIDQDCLNNYDNIIYDDTINLEALVNYLNNKEGTSPHLLKPLYVKKIEVQK